MEYAGLGHLISVDEQNLAAGKTAVCPKCMCSINFYWAFTRDQECKRWKCSQRSSKPNLTLLQSKHQLKLSLSRTLDFFKGKYWPQLNKAELPSMAPALSPVSPWLTHYTLVMPYCFHHVVSNHQASGQPRTTFPTLFASELLALNHDSPNCLFFWESLLQSLRWNWIPLLLHSFT